MKEPLIDMVEPEMIVSNSCCILDLDLVHCKKEDVEFTAAYKLKIDSNSKVHALVSWFDCHFSDLENPVTLSTSPFRKYTHWKNVVFYLDNDLRTQVDDVLEGSIAVRKSISNFRE
jgi:protein arginine N-methyltransferase 1